MAEWSGSISQTSWAKLKRWDKRWRDWRPWRRFIKEKRKEKSSYKKKIIEGIRGAGLSERIRMNLQKTGLLLLQDTCIVRNLYVFNSIFRRNVSVCIVVFNCYCDKMENKKNGFKVFHHTAFTETRGSEFLDVIGTKFFFLFAIHRIREQKWFETGLYGLLCKHCIWKPQVWELLRLYPETSMK